MKLKTYLKTLRSDEVIAIGASNGSAYLYIDKAGYTDTISSIFDDYLKRTKGWKDEYYRRACKAVVNGIGDNETPLSRAKYISGLYNAYKTAEKYIKEFVPVMSRNVTDAYTKVDGLQVVIVSGSESGTYWDKEEWDKNYGKDV